MIAMGGGPSSIARTCMGDVWVRRTVSGAT
jgi:hypothetical protein